MPENINKMQISQFLIKIEEKMRFYWFQKTNFYDIRNGSIQDKILGP